MEKKANTNREHTLEKMWNKKIIYDISPFSLIDFPDKVSCIVWFAGCNMRCSYCYNPEIVFGKGKMTLMEVLDFVISRKGLLDGVVFSGGECTLYKETIPFARALKKLGMLVKIDTNGSNPDILEKMLNLDIIDSVSLDFKAPREKFESITKSNFFKEFEKSLEILIKADIPFELRTTYHSDLLNDSDLMEMNEFVINSGYEGTYFIQNYIDSKSTVGNIGKCQSKILQKNMQKRKVVIRN